MRSRTRTAKWRGWSRPFAASTRLSMPGSLAASSLSRRISPICVTGCARPASIRSRPVLAPTIDRLHLRQDRPVLVRLLDVAGKVLLEENRAGRRRAAENVKLAVADQPVVRVGNDHFALGQRHRAEIAELRRVADRIGFEHVAMLAVRKTVDVFIPDVLEIRQSANGAPVG